MQIIVVATLEEKLKVVYDCLTTGLPGLAICGISLDYEDGSYEAAKESLRARGFTPDVICLEDVQVEIIRNGGHLLFEDTEDEASEPVKLNIELIEANWSKVRASDMVYYLKDDWDANVAENIMQMLLYGEFVYG